MSSIHFFMTLKMTKNRAPRFTERCSGAIANRGAFGSKAVLLANCAQVTWIERFPIGKAWFVSDHFGDVNADHWAGDFGSRQQCKLFSTVPRHLVRREIHRSRQNRSLILVNHSKIQRHYVGFVFSLERVFVPEDQAWGPLWSSVHHARIVDRSQTVAAQKLKDRWFHITYHRFAAIFITTSQVVRCLEISSGGLKLQNSELSIIGSKKNDFQQCTSSRSNLIQCENWFCHAAKHLLVAYIAVQSIYLRKAKRYYSKFIYLNNLLQWCLGTV
jgi:hypothetical protein